MKKKLILLIIFFVGIVLLLYPFVSQWYNSKVLSKTISNYNKEITKKDDYNKFFEDANNYNEGLKSLEFPLIQYKDILGYNELLNINNDGMMGYISIDKLNLHLPIYHGTSSSILNSFVGHLEGSSLPVGGIGTHSILAAHRGLPSSKLFTNLNELVIGDVFIITVFDRKLYYQVDNIVVVEQNDVSNLEIVKDKDYVTLVTCTPYGINTHRLLVRGSRVDSVNNEVVTLDNTKKDINVNVYLLFTVLILLVISVYSFLKIRGKLFLKEE